MTYRELLQLYKKGQLDEETRAEVARAIEQQDAIGEYLFEESEIPTLADGGEALTAAGENPEFVSIVQKSIRRAFWKLGVTVCAVVLIGALLAVFVLPKVVDLFYYDPTEIVGRDEECSGMETDRMSLDLAVWTEAFVPGGFRDQAIVTSRGYGRYDFYIPQGMSRNGAFYTVGGTLDRNRLTLFDPNVLRRPTGNAFVLPGNEDGGTFVSREASFEAVDQLSEDGWYQGYVSLSEIMDYEDWLGWYEGLELSDSYACWCAVYPGGEHDQLTDTLGFYPRIGGYVMHWDQEKYPRLRVTGDDWDAMETEEAAAEHVASMIRYLQDYPEFGEMMGRSMGRYQAEHVLESMERDGLRLYGFSIIARKDAFLALREDPHVNYLYTVPAR